MEGRRGSRRIPCLALLLLIPIGARSGPFEKTHQNSGGNRGGETVAYVNTRYGFRFDLPANWKGFCVVQKQRIVGSGEDAPLFLIRNPQYTKDDPREDIPIWVFTREQWKRVMRGDLPVSPAPILPDEVGRNTRYVFAVPPRYFNDNLPGYKEVFAILQSHPMHTFRPKTLRGEDRDER